jgi:hypothetical protein
VYDCHNIAQAYPELSVENVRIYWREPTNGVTSTTGVLFRGTGTGVESDTNPQSHPLDDTWRDSKDLIIGTVAIRNLAYAFPTDHVKLQITDVLRAFAKMQELYPQFDRRRQYWFGGSGAGWLSLQLAFYCPEQFAEIHAHGAITWMTDAADVQTSYTGDPADGWIVNTNFPSEQGALSVDVWNRYQAERELRSPIFYMRNPSSAARAYSPTFTDPPLVCMSHGTSDTTVAFYHMMSLRAALEQFAGKPAQVVEEPGWGQITQVDNWKFSVVYEHDHYYDRIYQSYALNHDCFTGRKLADPPSILNYTSPSSHGFAFQLTGSLKTATLRTISTTAAGDWQLYD